MNNWLAGFFSQVWAECR